MPKVSKSILKAAAEGNEKELRKIIKNSRKIKLRDNHNWTALHHAVASRSVPCVKMLLEETKLNPQDECYEGFTPLLLACSHHETPIEIIEALLQRDKTLVEYMSNEMQSPLHLAVSNNRLDIVQALVANGADVNYTDLDDDTPLHIAASKLNYDIIEYLLYNSRCDTALKNDFNMNPFELVVHLYEIDLLHMEQPENVQLVLKCLDLLSDFTFDEILNPDNELFDLKLKNGNQLIINFIINKYFLNSSEASSGPQYFTNLLMNFELYVYSAYLLLHDSVKSVNDLNCMPGEDDYTGIFNHLILNFRDSFYEIIYEILSKGDNCFAKISSRSDFVMNDFWINSLNFDQWPDICPLLFQFNYDLNLLRYKAVESLFDEIRFNTKLNCIRILNAFTTFDSNFIDFDDGSLLLCYNKINNADAFMDLFLPIYELQWQRLNQKLNINYVPSLKNLAVFNIRNIIFSNYPNNSACLKLRMIEELPIPKPIKKYLLYSYNV